MINLTHHEPSYQWIFWDSPVATYLWTHVRRILNLINQTLEISSPYEIPLLFLPNLDSPPDLHTLNRQNIITIAFYTLYTSELKLIRLFQQQKLDHNAHLQQWPREVYGFFIEALQLHIQLTPLFSDELYRRSKYPNKKGQSVKRFTQRHLAFLPPIHIDLHSLSDQHIRTYEDTWTHTGLVQINDRTLVFRHFHTYPP